MKETEQKTVWYFVDEAGDPSFYDRQGNVIIGQEGCSKVLILGFLQSEQPAQIRTALQVTQQTLANDPYLQGIPSLKKSLRAFHAKDDVPEVRQAVFKTLNKLEFKCQFIVARKKEDTFRRTFRGKESAFYDHLVTLLFRNVLHRASDNRIYFSTRGSRKRQQPLREAIEKGVKAFEAKWQTKIESVVKVQAQSPVGEPCLQAIDYTCWAIYRAYTKGDMRFFNVLADKVPFIWDLYDVAKYPANIYDKENPFDVKKLSPL